MTQHLEVAAETTVTITMSKEYADKLGASLGRALEAIDHLNNPDRREMLVNTSTIDHLLALKTALEAVTE